MKRSSVLLEWLEQFLEDWCSAWAAQVWTSWHRCRRLDCFLKVVSDTHCFHVSTRPVDGAKGIVFWIVPPLCNRAEAFFNPLAADFVLSVSVQLCFIHGAKLCWFYQHGWHFSHRTIIDYHHIILHMITILVSSASVSLTYFVYRFVS